MKKLFIPLVLVLVFVFILAGCSSATTTAPATGASNPPAGSTAPASNAAPAPGGQKYGGSLIWYRNMGIPSVGAPSDTPSQTFTLSLVSPVLEPVVTTDIHDRIMPQLAETIDIAPDGKSITLKMFAGIKFQDGTDLTAEAVKFNLEKCLANNCASSAILKKVTSYEILDPLTLKINLSNYDATFLLTLAQTAIGQIASPTALQKATNAQDMGKDHIIGTGPYKFDSWQTDQFIKMTKWDGYRVKGRPFVDTIEIRNSSDTTVSIMSFKAGEVNLVENIDPAQFVSLKAEGYKVSIPPLGFVFSIIPDSANSDSPFANKKVREALEYAIDKEKMCEGIGKGTQFPAYQCAVSPPLGEDAWYMPDIQPRKYAPVKAKELLAEAGYPNGFTYPLVSDVRIRQDMVVAVQTYLKAVGINTTLDMADVARAATFAKDGWKGILMPGFPNYSSFTSWLGAMADPVMTVPSRYSPPGWKEGWNECVATVDYDKRIAKMKELLKVTYDECLQVPYLQDGPRYVIDDKVRDIDWGGRHINGYFDPVNVWIDK